MEIQFNGNNDDLSEIIDKNSSTSNDCEGNVCIYAILPEYRAFIDSSLTIRKKVKEILESFLLLLEKLRATQTESLETEKSYGN